MTWNRLYGFKSYVRSSLWLVPFVAIPLEMVAIRIAYRFDGWLGWTFLGLALPEAQAILQAIVTATLSFVVFTFGSLLVAIQVASGQLTPRIIATTLLRDNVVKYTVGLFIFTLLFALSAQGRIATSVPQATVFLASVLGMLSFGAFFYLIDYAARLLRPVSILARVAADGLEVVAHVYPFPSRGQEMAEDYRSELGSADRAVLHEGTSEIVLAVNLHALMLAAERSNGIIEFVPQVGDFVGVDELCSICMTAPARSMIAYCGLRLRSAPSGRWNRIPHSRSASSLTSRCGHCRLRSMIRRRPCSPSISFTACCGGSARAICALMKPETAPSNCG